jgi:heme-degrading monooxygenase HmoA
VFAVIFEVQPKKERWKDYLDLAKQLRPKLEAIDGFIANERFDSTTIKGRVLSLSTWRDEKAVVRWRTHGEHHRVQEKGRFEVFEDYHLRVGEITADSAPPDSIAVEETRLDETQIGDAKLCTITEVSPPERLKIGCTTGDGPCASAARSTGAGPDRARSVRKHLQSGEAIDPGIVARQIGRSSLEAASVRRRGQAAAPAGPRDPRLRNV